MQLVGRSQAAEVIGVSRQRVQQLERDDKDFPKPLGHAGAQPIWQKAVIERYAKRREASLSKT